MSSFLYALAHGAVRRRAAVLVAWLVVLALLGSSAAAFGKSFDNSFSLPGTESQQALDSLKLTFPQVSGSTAQVIVIAPPGESVRTGATRTAIENGVKAFKKVDEVDNVNSPFGGLVKDVITPDNSAAVISVAFKVDRGGITTAIQDRLTQITAQIQADAPGSRASVGGDAFQVNGATVSPTEGVGVIIALIVLFFTLGSLRAAGLPLLTALLGVGVTMSLVFLATTVGTVSATTPLLALMLGLAVGIDYALFITSRHREQLGAGVPLAESISRAVATAGSAVVFAGLTVIIALLGLSVAGIPFLTTMGVAAAVGVAVAVVIALTLLPALLSFAGPKLTPKPRRRRGRTAAAAEHAEHAAPAAPSTHRVARGWVRLVTKAPVVTILVVIVGLAALAWPAQSLRLSLPDNGTADIGTPARTTYDLVASKFGPGYNGPLVVSAQIVGSDDPLGVMDKMADRIRALPGVASVPLATPNESASTGIIQVVPTTAPDAPATSELVNRIRALEPEFQADYGVSTAVTGVTAVQIDVSSRLGDALLPFGILVVGLSLVLLMMVFRSIAVPIKATLGYLLSVLASFGAVATVFEQGHFADALNVSHVGPVLSFLPILLMGILFGLAMDYEVFLVSRIREDFVHDGGLASGDARKAIETGFIGSSRVVVAAAVIMFAVFAAFVPEGFLEIKVIAFGLAVGVFVDAFIIRMSLVPAVLALLGKTAWKLPRWLDRLLPSLDVEGEALAHQLKQAEWPSPDNTDVIYAEGLRGADFGPVDIALAPGRVAVVEAGPATTSLLYTISGRMRANGGEVKALGLVLPQQASAVRRRTAFVDARADGFLDRLRQAERGRVQITLIDHAEAIDPADHEEAVVILSRLMDAPGSAAVIATADPYAAAPLLSPGTEPLLLNETRTDASRAELVGAQN